MPALPFDPLRYSDNFFSFTHDFNGDGWLDLFVANGHLDAEIERVQSRIRFAQPVHLFRNQGRGQFTEVTAAAGADGIGSRATAFTGLTEASEGGGDGDAVADPAVTDTGPDGEEFFGREVTRR